MLDKRIITGLLPEADRYRLLFERAPICIHEIDPRGRIRTMNPAGLGLAMIGEPAEGIGGRADIRSIPGRGTEIAIQLPRGCRL